MGKFFMALIAILSIVILVAVLSIGMKDYGDPMAVELLR